MPSFTESAKGLTRNPLGIIALFISFVYALACLVIGVSTKNLTPVERLPLIWYIIGFPVLTLCCFMVLVIWFSHKLYGPSDYQDEKNFMDTLRVSERMKSFSSAENDIIDQPEDSIDSLLAYSSIIGIFALYSVHLAYTYQKIFTLENLQANCEILDPQYTHGFFVAASASGAFSFTNHEGPYSVSSINEKLNAKIRSRIYSMVASDQSNSKYLTTLLKQLEYAFTTTSNNEQKADTSPRDTTDEVPHKEANPE